MKSHRIDDLDKLTIEYAICYPNNCQVCNLNTKLPSKAKLFAKIKREKSEARADPVHLISTGILAYQSTK